MNDIQAGKLIRKLRKENNLTMVNFAKELDLSQPSLSRIESGNQEITLSLMEKVCSVFNMSVSEFIHLLEDESELLNVEFSEEDKVTNEAELDMILAKVLASLSFDQKKGLYALLLPYIKD